MKPIKKVWLNILQLFALVTITASAQGQTLKADFSADLLTGCPPMVVTFSDLSTGGVAPLTYKWDLGNGTVSSNKNPVVAYFDAGAYTVTLTVTDANGVTDTKVKTQYIVVNALPSVNFGASQTTGCFPLPVDFSDSSAAGSGNIVSWQWDFGDGSLSSLQNPSHIYTGAGNYSVTLRVTNSNGCVKVFTKTAFIKILTGVKADFSYLSDPGCHTPTSVAFNNLSTGTGSISYTWDFGDGSTSNSVSPTHLYQNAGSYTVKLKISNSGGCSDSIIKPNAINIGFVKADFSAPATACVGQSFTINNTSNPSTVSSYWRFGDGTTSTDINPSVTYNAPGTYQIKLVNDFGGCKDSIVKAVSVSIKPTAAFTASNTISCSAPVSVPFTDNSTGAVSYAWDFGDNSISTLQNPTHVYTAAGKYTVTLTVINSGGCTDVIVKTDLIKVQPPKIASLLGFSVRGCIPYTVDAGATIVSNLPITSYLWKFGDGSTSTSATPSHTYTTPGSYSVTLIVSSGAGCIDSVTYFNTVKVGNKPTTAFSATPLSACAETGITFSDLSTAGPVDEWYWNFGDGGTSTDQNPIHPYSDTGKFTVFLIATSSGCSDTLKKIDYIRISPPIAKFDTLYNCSDRLTRTFKDKSIGATSWDWDFGDGSTSTTQSPTHTYGAPGSYLVVLRVSNGTCQHTSKRTVKVVNERGQLTISDIAACRNARVVFGVANVIPTNIQTYSWYFNGLGVGSPAVTSNAPVAISYANSGTMPIAVITNDILGCKDTIYASVPVQVYGPKVGFSASAPGTCSSTPVNFIDTSSTDGVNPITQWIWNFGDNNTQTFTAPPFAHTYTNAGTYGVSLTVVDAHGCRDSVNKPNLIAITQPTASFTVSDTMFCPNTPIIITNASSGVETIYTWNYGDGTTETTATPAHNYTTEGNFTISVNMVDKYGCTASQSKDIKVYTADAKFLMSETFSSCPPLLVDFTSNSTNFTSQAYDFGDGGTSTLLNPSHLYTYPGVYFVKRWAINNGGCTDTVIQKVTIQGPTGTFSYNPTQVCNPSPINFVANAINTVQYIWDYNDGSTIFSNQTSTTHTYTTKGVYLPKIILEDASGCRVPIVGTDTIRVSEVETYIRALNKPLCDSGYVAFSDSTITNDGIKDFTWDFGDGTTSNQQTPNHLYASSGLYTVKLTATTLNGCTNTATIDNFIKVVSSPAIKIVGINSACEASSLSFQGTLTRPDTATLSWNWSFGNGQTSNLQNPAAQLYPAAGSYTITSVAVDMDGCRDSTSYIVDIHPNPVVNAGPDSIICRYQTIMLQPSGATTYVWDPQPSLSCLNCATPNAKPDFMTQYRVTGTTQFGCVGSDSLVIDVRQPFKMQVGQGDTLCVGESFTLKASGASTYQWSPASGLNSSTSATPVATPGSTTSYQVIGKDDKNCFSDTGVINLKVYPIPQIQITGDSIRTLLVGNTSLLATTSSPDITKWKWSPSQALSCITCPSPTTNTTFNSTYTVVATNDGSCIARDQVTILVLCNNANIYIPNTFSPNADGTNDVFYPRGKGIFSIKSFKIFNRWGQIVFSRGAMNANDASQGWDGSQNGVKLTPDVFVFIAEVVCENGAVFPIKGNVTLIR